MSFQLRQTLRPAMATAPLTGEARFVRETVAAYRAMWQDWLTQTTTKYTTQHD